MATSTSVHDITKIVVNHRIMSCEGRKDYQVVSYSFFKDGIEVYELTAFAPDELLSIPTEYISK